MYFYILCVRVCCFGVAVCVCVCCARAFQPPPQQRCSSRGSGSKNRSSSSAKSAHKFNCCAFPPWQETKINKKKKQQQQLNTQHQELLCVPPLVARPQTKTHIYTHTQTIRIVLTIIVVLTNSPLLFENTAYKWCPWLCSSLAAGAGQRARALRYFCCFGCCCCL